MADGIGTDKATILILLIGEASGVFAGFCPSWFTVASPFFHEQASKDGNIKRIRAGEVAATAIVMGTGWAVAQGPVGKFALLAAAGISLVFVAGYEYQIRNPSKKPDNGSGGQATDSAMSNYWGSPT
jgi:hypothetical protein